DFAFPGRLHCFQWSIPPYQLSAHCSGIANYSLPEQCVTERYTPPPHSKTLPSHN
ncbi:unnamed protein product, partial [Staurois parvus]